MEQSNSTIGTGDMLNALKAQGGMVLPGQAAVTAQEAVGFEAPNFVDEEDEANVPQDAKPEGNEPAAGPNDTDADDLPEEPSAVNFKKLRESRKEERKLLAELKAKYEETETKLKRYENGEVAPEIIRKKDERIAYLEPLAEVVDLKVSEEYEEEFVKPAQALRTKLEKLGEDYGVIPEVMHQLVGVTSRKELNKILSDHFGDVGGLEVKQIIDQLHDLGTRAEEADKAPKQTLEALKTARAQKKEEEKKQRLAKFETTSRSAWNHALTKTKDEAVFDELILHPTDSKYNKEVVEPTQYKAALQFGALVKKLEQNGLHTLPEDLANNLARLIQISIGSALAAKGRYEASQENGVLRNNLVRTKPYMRPGVGTSNGSGHASKHVPETGPTSFADAGKAGAAYFNNRR